MNLYCNTQFSELGIYDERPVGQLSNQYMKRFHSSTEIAHIDVILFRLIPDACNVFGCLKSDLKTKTRKRETVMARQMVCFLLWKFTRMSLEQIAGRVGRDHATVLHSSTVISNLIETDKSFKMLYVTEFEHYARELKEIGIIDR